LSFLKVLKTYPVQLFINALNKYGKGYVNRLIENFKSLLKSLRSQSINLKQCYICFSYRHYPILDLDKSMFEIYTKDKNQRDISTFVDN